MMLTKAEEESVKERYEKEYGKLMAGHHLSIWVSKNNNLIVRHFFDWSDWNPYQTIREVNFGQYPPDQKEALKDQG